MTTAEETAHAADAVRRSAKRTREVFAADFGQVSALVKPPQPAIAPDDASPFDRAQKASVAARIHSEYSDVQELPAVLAQKQANAQAGLAARRKKPKTTEEASDSQMAKMIESAASLRDQKTQANGTSTALTESTAQQAQKLHQMQMAQHHSATLQEAVSYGETR